MTVAELERLKQLFTLASQCPVQLEPVPSTERARSLLLSQQWDVAILPPGLTALALADSGYVAIRPLGRANDARSVVLVRTDSGLEGRGALNNKRIGLLPRGSLTGFYLPLFNLHGLTLNSVSYDLSYPDLMAALLGNEVDAIAWDSAVPFDEEQVRILHRDDHPIPRGAMVMRQSLVARNHQPMLNTLDEAVAQWPSSVGYAPGILPDQKSLQQLRGLIQSVEAWTLPLDGQRYAVFGRKEVQP